MKTLMPFSANFRRLVTSISLLLVVSILFSMTSRKSTIFNNSTPTCFAVPDTIPPDSLPLIDTISVAIAYNVTDTATVYLAGLDSIFLLQEDTTVYRAQYDSTITYYIGEMDTSIHFEKPVDSLAFYYVTDSAAYYIPDNETNVYALVKADTVDNPEDYIGQEKLALAIHKDFGRIDIITVSSIPKPINHDLYGINIEGLFKQHTLPYDGHDGGSSEYAYDWLAELAPRVIRFPSGESSKFMHLMHNTNGTNSVGYGYDIKEIARYFDQTGGDKTLAAAAAEDGITVNEERLVEDPEEMEDWMDVQFTGNYLDFLLKWKEQQCVDHAYIEDFINLIHTIDAANPGRPKVHVILTLNVISETASECLAIADYLRANNVNVIGVEMGNETYADFYCKSVGFSDFTHYYDYLNGNNYTGGDYTTTESENLDKVLSDAMWYGGHDYLNTFQNIASYNYKVGLVGKPIGGEFAFKAEDGGGGGTACSDDNWNYLLSGKYDETISGKYAFDAVIMHTYYSADNWDHFVYDIYNFVLSNLTPCNPSPYPSIWDDLWHFGYADPDVRLQTMFEKLRGNGYEEGETGNYMDFLSNHATTPVDLYKYSMLSSFKEFGNQLDLDRTDAGKKDLWVTEWNNKTVITEHTTDHWPLDWPVGIDITNDLQQKMLEAPSNTFLSGYLLMRWWLKEIEMNYSINDFRQNFFTISTMQGYGGGVWSDLLTLTTGDEREAEGTNIVPWEDIGGTIPETPGCDYIGGSGKKFLERNYWMRRMNYYVARLFSDISRNHLLFVPSAFLYDEHNINLPPMVFIDDDVNPQYIYVYFTNVKDVIQNYTLDPQFIRLMFTPDADDVILGIPQINYIIANELYSTFGNGKLYNTSLNNCYADYEQPTYLANAQMVWGDSYPPSCIGAIHPDHCFTALPYTIGYFKIPVYPYYEKEGQIQSRLEQDILIYPNPSNDAFSFIPFNGNANYTSDHFALQIFNLQGDLMMAQSVTSAKSISIKSLPAGCYLLSFTDPQGIIINKQFVKIE